MAGPAYRNIISVLQNPLHAGAYAYGRSETRTKIVDGRVVKRDGHDRPRDQWTVLLRNHHEGYITWEHYEHNQERIRRNAYSKPAGEAKSARGGRALLSSLLRCRRCGRILRVAYSGHHQLVRYSCNVGNAMHGLAPCINFGATRPDLVVARMLLDVVQPMALEAAIVAENLRFGDLAILSASPEQFLRVDRTGLITAKPIKGTRRRGANPEEDEQIRAELRASVKDRAENLMIVDLMRNDIGSVSEIGTVEVPSLLAVESYAQVHQLVSTVRGQLAPGLVGMDAVVACFPAGSMTGTPKSSATRILDSLEDAPRGIYSGVFGYFGLDGRIDLAMVIRSIVMSPAGATIGAGGGITALSVPDEELAEVDRKSTRLNSSHVLRSRMPSSA